jgi:NitT/TauT family transport system substrate-binding protein
MSEKITLKIGHIRITDHLILGITKYKQDSGEEKFEHFHLETVVKTGWNEVDEGITSGELDGAFILAPMAIDLFKSGQKIKLILLGHKNGSSFVKNKRAKIQSLNDLKGKTVLIPYQLSIHHMLLHKLLVESGLKPGFDGDVKLEVIAPSQIPEAVQWDEEGEIGGFIVAEPFGSQVITEGYGEEFYLSKDLWSNHPCCVFILKEDILKNHPQAVKELIQSLVKSGEFIEKNPDKAAEIGSSFLNQKVEVLKRVLTTPPDRIRTDELLPIAEDLDKIQSYMTEKMGVMRSKININDLLELTFAKEAGAK